MVKQICIEYADPNNLADTYPLTFNLNPHSVADKWANILSVAIGKHSIDDPGRFYGFGSIEEQTELALTKINHTIDVINSYEKLIDRTLTDVSDQDTLNYLHHIFEVYHGLLDHQIHAVWKDSPDHVHRALADLNIQVHECENISRSITTKPAQVTTWYKLPKLLTLATRDYSLFEACPRLGVIYLNYAEIGKTLEHLSIDNDSYMHEDAFKPFRNISADFCVTFYNDPESSKDKYVKMKQFYDANTDFFVSRELPWGHPYLAAGAIPVAELETIPADLIDQLKSRQWIKSIKLL